MAAPLIPLLLKILAPVIVREVVTKVVDRATKPKEPQMEAVFGLMRHALTTLGGVFVTKGYLAASDLEVAAGAIVALLGVVWSVIEKKRRA